MLRPWDPRDFSFRGNCRPTGLTLMKWRAPAPPSEAGDRMRVFMSHSGKNTLEAKAVKRWLIENEKSLKGEIFLDVDDLLPGQEWKEALQQASQPLRGGVVPCFRTVGTVGRVHRRISVRGVPTQEHRVRAPRRVGWQAHRCLAVVRPVRQGDRARDHHAGDRRVDHARQRWAAAATEGSASARHRRGVLRLATTG